jgi:hypothetical protein
VVRWCCVRGRVVRVLTTFLNKGVGSTQYTHSTQYTVQQSTARSEAQRRRRAEAPPARGSGTVTVTMTMVCSRPAAACRRQRVKKARMRLLL